MTSHTWLVAEREVRESLRHKGIWATAAVLLLAGLALAILPEVLPNGSLERDLVTVGDVPAAVSEALGAAADGLEMDLTVDTAANSAVATALVKDGDADLALVWPDASGAEPRILQRTDDHDIAVSMVQQVLAGYRTQQVFDAAGIPDDVLAEAAAIAPVPVDTVDAERGGRQGAAFGLTVVMYIVIMVLASGVASSVATEKANRVSEVLLAVVPARSLLYGKVLGVGTVGFGMVLVGALPLLVKTIAGGDVPQALGTTLASSGAWLAGGIVIYLLLAAMLGALADRTEDVGSAVAPLTIGLVAIYLVSLGTTENTVGMVLSIVPLSSPIAMPARLAIGVAEPWQVVTSLALLAAAVVFVARLAASVYGRAIVRTGRRLKLTEVLRRTRTGYTRA